MIENKHLLSSCWDPEDVQLILQGLSLAYPKMGLVLRQAIILLSMDEVRPCEGRVALRRRAVSFARHCPPTVGLEHGLNS